MKKQIILNVLSNYAGRLVGIGLGFFLVPFLITKMGKEVFGLIVLFESAVLFVEVLSTSARVALSRHATFVLSQGRDDEFLSYLSTGRVLFFVLAALVLSIGLLISLGLPVLFRISPNHQQEARFLFALMTGSFAVTVPNMAYWSGLYARQRYDLIHFSTSLGVVSRGLALFVLFSLLPDRHINLATYGWIYLGMTWVQNFFIFMAFKRIFPGFRFRWNLFDARKAKEMLSFGFYMFSSHSGSVVHDNVIQWLINRMWTSSANAVYGIGIKISAFTENIISDPAWTLTPTFTDLAAKGEKERLKQFLFAYSKGMATLVIPVCLVLIAFASSILDVWVGPEFSEAAAVMRIYLFAQIIYLSSAVCHNIPNAYGRVKLPGVINPLTSLVSVVLCYLLSVRFQWGLCGVATGESIVLVFYTVFFGVPYALRLAGFSASEYWKETYFKPLLWALLFWGSLTLALFLRSRSFSITYASLLSLLSGCPFYFFGVYRWVLNKKDRGYVHEGLAVLKSKLS